MIHPFYQFTLGFLLSYILLHLILPCLHHILLDTPNHRSSHKLPTPRGGGLSFVVVGTILNFIFTTGQLRWIPIICLPIAFIGIVDDYKDIPPSFRYMVQLSTALILVLIAKFPISIWEIPIYCLLISAIINFFNFMDGIDGMVAGCSVPILLASSSWSFSGSVFGFFLWNWSPAKVFMGDVGSTFLGTVFSGIAFQQTNPQDVVSLILVCFPLFADSSICIFRRLFYKQNIFRPHKQHLYQRLHQAGWSHANVSSIYIVTVTLNVLFRTLDNLSLLIMFLLLQLIVGFFLDTFVATKFKHS